MLSIRMTRICTLETRQLCLNFSARAHPPAKKKIVPPPRCCAGAAQPYTRLCVCSGSLLTRSKRNINSSCQVPGLHRVEVQRPISKPKTNNQLRKLLIIKRLKMKYNIKFYKKAMTKLYKNRSGDPADRHSARADMGHSRCLLSQHQPGYSCLNMQPIQIPTKVSEAGNPSTTRRHVLAVSSSMDR